MIRQTTILILTLATIHSWGQTKEQKQREERIQLVFDSSLPDDLYSFYHKSKIETDFKINGDMNPFYLRGDFDGDKKLDYALAIIEKKSNKKGILIYHPTTKKYFFVGAGTSIPNGHGDDYQWMDSWEVTSRETVKNLICESILVQKLESSSGLIYWDGKEYKWQQEGD
jgi:hypothetical protein